jgi:hypothetical protein
LEVAEDIKIRGSETSGCSEDDRRGQEVAEDEQSVVEVGVGFRKSDFREERERFSDGAVEWFGPEVHSLLVGERELKRSLKYRLLQSKGGKVRESS